MPSSLSSALTETSAVTATVMRPKVTKPANAAWAATATVMKPIVTRSVFETFGVWAATATASAMRPIVMRPASAAFAA